MLSVSSIFYPSSWLNVFIPLDVFRTIVHNNGIRNELEAWLAFLAFDDPKTIWEIRNAYPKFDALYQDMFEFRKTRVTALSSKVPR